MKCLLAAINAKYIHSNLAVYDLKAYAEMQLEAARRSGALPESAEDCRIELAEYTINHHAAEILDDLYMKNADILCFSCYIWNIEYVRVLVKNLKKLNPETPIWLGGPEVSFECETQLRELPEADGILYGEGEQSFAELLLHYIKGDPFPKGSVHRESDGRIVTEPPARPVDMDTIPFVYRDLKEFENRIIYYESSRGCPFSCSYCLSSVDRHLRFRSLSLVEQELAFFMENRAAQVKFVDRTFNCSKPHAMAIWKWIRDHDNGVTNFHFEIAADLLDEEEIALIKTMRPGLIQLEIGIQSANPKTIEAVRRKMDLKKAAEAVRKIREGGNVHQHLDLIAGLPWEDYESFGDSFDTVYRMEPSQLQLGFLKVLKGSAMHREAEHFGILYQEEPPFEVLQTRWLSHGELIALKRVEEMVESFYNSCQFQNTMRELQKYFRRPFELYEALGNAYARRRMGEKKHARSALYEFVLEFAAEEIPEQKERFRQLLTLDYYLRENARKRPDFALPEEVFREEAKQLCREWFPDIPVRQLLREKHVEMFDRPFTAERQFWLFDYENRDALTGNASVRQLKQKEQML